MLSELFFNILSHKNTRGRHVLRFKSFQTQPNYYAWRFTNAMSNDGKHISFNVSAFSTLQPLRQSLILRLYWICTTWTWESVKRHLNKTSLYVCRNICLRQRNTDVILITIASHSFFILSSEDILNIHNTGNGLLQEV